MNTCIVTVFKTHNSGSFFQALALNEQLSRMGTEVRFCDYTPKVDALSGCVDSAVRCCLKFRFKRAVNIIKKYRGFIKFQKQFKTVQFKNENADVFFFGSDTLWNFHDSFFKNQTPFFTGAGIEKSCYAYSMSVGSTSKEEFAENIEAVKNIQKFKKIAVRDSHSEDVISKFYSKENIVRTIDPTLLMEKEFYVKNFFNENANFEKSLVVYYFGKIPQDMWKKIVDFSRERKLKIVNVGFYEKEYDVSIASSPANFITAFSNAEYIFTNTFHGCVFSTIFNKQFATDGIYKKKIEGFLEEFSLLDRVVTTPEDVEKVFTTPVNYNNVNELIKEARKRSVKYLQDALDEVKGNE